MITKSNFRTVKSHEEYLIYRTFSIWPNCKSFEESRMNSYEAFAQFEELAVNGTSRTLEKWLIDCQLSSLTTFKFQAGVSSTLKRCTIAHFNRVFKNHKKVSLNFVSEASYVYILIYISQKTTKTKQNKRKQIITSK